MSNNKPALLPDNSIVRMDGVLHESKDFIAIHGKETGDASIYYNTDALTLGMAIKLVSKEFVRCMMNCTEEERNSITAILGDAFMIDNMEEVANEEHSS